MTKAPDSGNSKRDETPPSVEQYLIKDPEDFAMNIARMIEQAGKAASAWVEPREKGDLRDTVAEPAADMVKTFSKLTEYWLSDPNRALEAQTRLFSGYMDVWSKAIQRTASGETPEPPPIVEIDKRFQDPEWGKNAFFDFLKQVYIVTSRWAGDLVTEAEGLDQHTRHKAGFYMKQITNAISPSNFILTNPELFRETVASNGDNLVRGMKMLAEDIAAGHGDLKLRQADYSVFEVGRNIATSPGKVVARSALAEIIQYEASTDTVLKRPLLICPPWINKFYILDLNPEKSFIRWAVSQGHSVFVISWVNPDERHARMSWEDYIHGGIELGLDTVSRRDRRNVGERHRLLCRRHAARRRTRPNGEEQRPAHPFGDAVHHAGRLHPCRRSQGVRR
jgi:polyhydroxyalkanoate synthase